MKVGFIGLGRMGAAMAQNIQAAGHHLFVNDVRRAACDPVVETGADYLGAAREIAAQSEIILISVLGPAEVTAVLSGPEGLLAGLAPDTKQVGIDITDLNPSSDVTLPQFAIRGLPRLGGPVIVFIEPRGYKHFVVLRGTRGDRVYLADPSRGNIRMPAYRFLDSWLGENGTGWPGSMATGP